MVSNLIQPPAPKNAPAGKKKETDSHSVTAENCARLFVNGMGDAQRERFKLMLQSGIQCGESVARSYGVPLNDFVAEVRKII